MYGGMEVMKAKSKNSVLIVDDERANIIALTHILSQEYIIFVAKNGQDAIEVAKEYLPALILLDILMPDMDGYDVLSLLKNTEETRTIPVIFITGLVKPEDEEKGMALGASDYITKPFSSEIVKLRVRNQMQILDQINTINQRLRQQTLMASISQSFVSNSDIDTLFTNTLRTIGEFMGVAQVLLFDLEEDEITLTCRNEWINPALNHLPTRIGGQFVLKEPMLSVIRGLTTNGSNLCLHSNDPAFKSAMRQYRANFVNYITTPIFIRGKMCAVMDFSREEDGWDWSESDINFATIVASILSGVYERSVMERQSSIVENSPQFIVYLSTDGEVSYVNPAASELTGHAKAEIMAGGLELIFDPETARAIKDTYIPNTLQNNADSFEVNMKGKDGEIRTLAFTSFVAENSNIGAIALDVTEMHALEAALITAKEQAEQSSRAKSEFLSRMSHEMRTPMNAIIGMTHLAKISDTPEQKADCLEEIDNASRHLLQLIDDVLDVSSLLEENTSFLEYSGFSFNTMLNDVLKTMQLYTDEKKQTMTSSIDPRVPDALFGDKRRVTQVIRNLLMNANKFTPERGTINLDACVFGEEGGAVVLKVEVSDNGIGIPKEKQAQIFNSFEQVDGGLNREYSGVGLGLTISKHIVEMMGGGIWVESEPGKGAKFTFTFKAKNVQDKGSEYNGADEFNKTFDGKTALLVEDVEINREILMAMLEDTQLQIDCAENGLQAVEMFSADPGRYDIVLMDINLPVMDGWEAARRIRALDVPEGALVKIVALTANTLREHVERSRDAGMNDHIGKPIDFDELLRKLDQYLNGR
jgi:PAS domain S-box-containing protein